MVHFAVSPGLLRSLDGALDVAFTDPPSSPRAQIDVFETDSWVSDGTIVKEENGGGRMKRATIEGTLSSGVFVRTSITQYFTVTDPDTKETKIVIRKDDAPPPAADGKLFFVTTTTAGPRARYRSSRWRATASAATSSSTSSGG